MLHAHTHTAVDCVCVCVCEVLQERQWLRGDGVDAGSVCPGRFTEDLKRVAIISKRRPI